MALGRRGQWANCKHLYFNFIVICRLDAKVDDFIYAPCFSFNEVKGILVNEILNHKSLQLVTKRGSHLNSKGSLPSFQCFWIALQWLYSGIKLQFHNMMLTSKLNFQTLLGPCILVTFFFFTCWDILWCQSIAFECIGWEKFEFHNMILTPKLNFQTLIGPKIVKFSQEQCILSKCASKIEHY
jgi:hypothetical protein